MRPGSAAKSRSRICPRPVQMFWQLTGRVSLIVQQVPSLGSPPVLRSSCTRSGFRDPRFLLTAPNGDIFVAESRANQIKVLRDTKGSGKPDVMEIFAERDLNKPFGIAFYPPGNDPQFLYVANTDGIIRFPYRNGDLKARGPAQKLGCASFPVAQDVARRRTLDTRHRFFARWQENVCLDRFTLECFR